MKQADIDEGRLIIKVSFAPLKQTDSVFIRIVRKLAAVASEIG